MITTHAADASSDLRYSTSTHALNDNEVRLNYISWFIVLFFWYNVFNVFYESYVMILMTWCIGCITTLVFYWAILQRKY